MSNIIVESDCLELVQASRNEIVRGEIFNIVQDIIFLKTRFQKVAFTWIARAGNQPAHHAALLASRNGLHVNWVWNPPLSLSSLIEADKQGRNRNSFPFDPGIRVEHG